MNKIYKKLTLVALMIAGFAFVAGNKIVTYAGNPELLIEIGDNVVDVEQLAEENNVDPYELKQAILEGMNSEKASPFSDLATITGSHSDAEEESTVSTDGDALADLIVTKSNQDSTAYVAKAGSYAASNKVVALGMCAMKKSVTTKTGSTTETVVKLGTKIYMNNPVDINGTSYSSFVVEDRGDGTNRSTYWIDIYFGDSEGYDEVYYTAINYGLKTVSYYYYIDPTEID